MSRSSFAFSAGIFFFLIAPLHTQSQVSTGISFGTEGVQGFYLAIGEYYHVPERQVIVIHERHIPDEELPVVFYIARRAHVAPEAVMDLRLSGKSWWEITMYYRMGPEIYYVPVDYDPGPPYGRAYGYYKHKPRKQWRSMALTDVEVVDLVNLRFVSDHYGYRPHDVIRMRSEGRNFVDIRDEARKVKGEKHGWKRGRGNGKGKGRK